MEEQHCNNAMNFLYDRYYSLKNINEVIPIYKHLEYCNEVADRVLEVWDRKDEINWDSYEQYNNEEQHNEEQDNDEENIKYIANEQGDVKFLLGGKLQNENKK